jgi:hypothetical protein
MEENKVEHPGFRRNPFLREVYIRNSGFQGKDSAKSNSSGSAIQDGFVMQLKSRN